MILKRKPASDFKSNSPAPSHSKKLLILPSILGQGSWIMGNFRIWIGHPEKNKDEGFVMTPEFFTAFIGVKSSDGTFNFKSLYMLTR